MADSIIKEIAIERIKRVKPHVVMSEYGVGYERGLKDAIGILNATPAADVQPVKRGRWVHDGSGHDGRDNWYHCRECNRALNLICGKKLEDYPYCHCGARMDGDANE